MLSLVEVFEVRKPIIGVIHLLPLPGSPKYDHKFEEVIKRALEDAKAYVEGGVDGLIIENFGDVPYFPDRVGPETVAAMAVIALRVREEVDIPFGVNVLRNDAIAALSIAHATGGSFIRVNVLTEVMVTDQGLIQGVAHKLLRYRKLLGAEKVRIFADVHVKHAKPLMKRPVELSAKDLVQRGLADAVIVTGEITGAEVELDKVARVKEAVKSTPVLVGSGINAENVCKYLKVCDGVIVGTSVKKGCLTENPVDVDRVRKLVRVARESLRA